ncbi:histidine--tRNA ligase [candidate division TA06 bacterium]|uniref:Histidine--tRNA ligase n=1 Tax=candidate division TA06 bacterium TaxID=2250710 RepID=A0A523XTY3_UNCT6|nr:MAG: histidine--tRNA ligase [candidate division TA06 bacterium]
MIKGPKGIRDILPEEIPNWHHMEACIRETMSRFNYKEIRFPTFEETELFTRSIGVTTDIVEKQMYTFQDAGKRSLTLIPEGTASVVRAYIEHGMAKKSPYVKLYYISRMYRYESPQAGRYRQHSQFGIEAIGSDRPAQDVEVIQILLETLKTLGLKQVELKVNSIGCFDDRMKYTSMLRDYLRPRLEKLCKDCQRRFDSNPLRSLDCKKEQCIKETGDVPRTVDHMCSDCTRHFDTVKEYLSLLGMEYIVDPRLVRGLDYYTRTVFEAVSTVLGGQDSLGGGGRYDRLVEELGGEPTPAAGFAAGMERILLAMEKEKVGAKSYPPVDLFIAVLGEKAQVEGMRLAISLRAQGISCHMDIVGRSLKAQMRQADKMGARKVLIIGGDELKSGKAQLKKLETGAQTEVSLSSSEEISKEVKK